jgi:hypothetical protein
MIISVINHTGGTVADERVQEVIRSVNRQIEQDFQPYWGFGATLRLEGKRGPKPDAQSAADMRGDAVLYLWNDSDVDGALGYHDANFGGIPYGFVFTELSTQLDGDWSVTFSHEALELLADPEVNLLVQGPHPTEERYVFHWFEMCDAVQSEPYVIEGVRVSNFVLPLYFTGGDETGSRNDFLGTGVRSFATRPGGYIGFFDPQLNSHTTWAAKGDAAALTRIEIKGKAQAARRSQRYPLKTGGRRRKDGPQELAFKRK